jgi:hypothetical protein
MWHYKRSHWACNAPVTHGVDIRPEYEAIVWWVIDADNFEIIRKKSVQYLIEFYRSFMNKFRRRSPRTEPWRTPDITGKGWESARNANPGSSVGWVTAKPATISITESKEAQFMQEHIMRGKVENIREIKIYNISLTLTADNRCKKVKKHHQIGNRSFSSGDKYINKQTIK